VVKCTIFMFEFNDFLAIFLKAIFKDVVCSIASTV
jgi:hypothetical protein